MDNKKQSHDPVQAFEQMEAHSMNIAELIASYYKQLRDKGIPERLADDLTREFHMLVWTISGANKYK